MPPLFYVPHEDPAFDSFKQISTSYLPAEMVPKPPKRAGGAFQMPTQHAAQPPANAAAATKRAASSDGSGDTPAAAAADSSPAEEAAPAPPAAKRTRAQLKKSE